MEGRREGGKEGRDRGIGGGWLRGGVRDKGVKEEGEIWMGGWERREEEGREE